MESRTSVILDALIRLHLPMDENPERAVYCINTNKNSALEFSGTLLVEHKTSRIGSFNSQR